MGEGRVCQFFLQLVAQHLCFASWKALLPVSPLACATCCATTFSLANCNHMFHEVKDGSTFCNESWCLLIVLPLALQHATQQSRRKRFSLASPFKRAQVTSVRALTSQWTWWTKLMYSLRLGRLNYHCEVSFYTYWDFSLRNLLSQNLVHNFLQPIKSEKRQFYAWRKRFVGTCQKYWVFTPYPSPTPSVYLKLSFVVGCLNILKGVWSSIVKLISQN